MNPEENIEDEFNRAFEEAKANKPEGVTKANVDAAKKVMALPSALGATISGIFDKGFAAGKEQSAKAVFLNLISDLHERCRDGRRASYIVRYRILDKGKERWGPCLPFTSCCAANLHEFIYESREYSELFGRKVIGFLIRRVSIENEGTEYTDQ